jgi:D-alanine-D-alanine ligase
MTGNDRRFRRVAVLKGGPSSEREVSLRSGSAVAQGLRDAGYEVTEVDVTGCEVDLPPGIDGVFVALHGGFGEDGQVQRLLAEAGLPYTGAGPAASRTAFDKKLTKEVLVDAGIPTAGYEILDEDGVRTLDFPVVVKPLRQGSSIGVWRVFNEDEWRKAFADALAYDGEIIVENYIEGHELTVGIVNTEALPVVEIVAPDEWYDYRAKYTSGATTYLVPAPISEDAARKCREVAWKTFTVLNCRGFGRVDFRMTNDDEIYVLELNTIPGFTETSLLPKAAGQAGIGFSELCRRIMESASAPAEAG